MTGRGGKDEEGTVGRPDKTEEKRWQKTEKKESERARAEVIAERSRTLSPLERDITRIEKRIMELEERVRDENSALIRASQVGEGRTISALSVSIHNAKKEIEELSSSWKSSRTSAARWSESSRPGWRSWN